MKDGDWGPYQTSTLTRLRNFGHLMLPDPSAWGWQPAVLAAREGGGSCRPHAAVRLVV